MARALSADDTRFIALSSLFFCHLFLRLLFLSRLNSVRLCVCRCPCRFEHSTARDAASPNNRRPAGRELSRDKIKSSLYVNAPKDELMGGTYSTHDGNQICVDFCFQDPKGRNRI